MAFEYVLAVTLSFMSPAGVATSETVRGTFFSHEACMRHLTEAQGRAILQRTGVTFIGATGSHVCTEQAMTGGKPKFETWDTRKAREREEIQANLRYMQHNNRGRYDEEMSEIRARYKAMLD